MDAKIDILRVKDTDGSEYAVYPKTLIKCITNENGDDLEDTLQGFLEEKMGEEYATKEAFDGVVDGTTVVGNASKLGGKGASEYALGTDLANHVYNSTTVNTDEEFEALLQTLHANAKDGSYYEHKVVISYQHSVIGGGHRTIEGFRQSSNYGYVVVKAWKIDGGCYIYTRSIINGTWKDWELLATTADLDSAMNAYSYTLQRGATEEETDAILNSMHSSCTKDKMHYYGAVTSGVIHSVLKGWTWFVEGFYADANYGWQKISTYTGGENGYFRVIYDGTWTPWVKNVDHYDLANYLPLTGGELYNGTNMVPLTLKGHGQASYITYSNNSVGKLGSLGLFDKDIPAYVSANGNDKYALLHSGNVGSYALPIGGGTVANTNSYVMSFKRNESGKRVMNRFENADGTLGYIGLESNGRPVFVASSGTTNDILHTGNKPTGSYTGTGVARTVPTGGVGNGCVVWGGGYISFGFNTVGGFSVHCENGTVVPHSTAFWFGTDGNIYINSTHDALNASGVTYTYQVL